MHHLITALRPSSFVDSLCKKPVANLDELRTRATKFMQMEELKEFRNTTHGETHDRKHSKKERAATFRSGSRFREQRQSKCNRYTPLISNRAQILEEALNVDLISPPRKVPTPPHADTTKHYRYHQNYGHTTEKCFTLKDKIEELIQSEHLKRFVKRENGGYSSRKEDREGGNERKEYKAPTYRGRREDNLRRKVDHKRDEQRDTQEKPLRRVINYIVRDFASGGSTTSAKKKYVRAFQSVNAVFVYLHRCMPLITFRDDDFQAIDPQHDDPMVISVEIKDFAVRKTLVDQGSSVDILYWGTFKKLGISKTNIQHYLKPIVGFSGERVDTRGYIDLFTKFGGEKVTRTVKIRYLIIDVHISYNILLGRPSLNTLGAVVSTYRFAMRFPSAFRDIITIQMDQPTARKCYVDSLRGRPKSPLRCAVHNIKRTSRIEGADLDTRFNDDTRVEPVEITEKHDFREGLKYTHVGKSYANATELK